MHLPRTAYQLLRRFLKNLSDQIIENLVVTVECTPSIIRTRSWNIDRIVVGNESIVSDLEIPLDTTLLSGLNEAELGSLKLTVHSNGKYIN